ncbi:MAG: hypothetical protein ACJAYU_001336 [Bradymonadia bacterium]
MKDGLDQLRLFVEVVRQRVAVDAARALDMPRSTVSRRGQRLERRTGGCPLQGTSRGVQITNIDERNYAQNEAADLGLRPANAQSVGTV